MNSECIFKEFILRPSLEVSFSSYPTTICDSSCLLCLEMAGLVYSCTREFRNDAAAGRFSTTVLPNIISSILIKINN